jgi:hypothetical protein
MPTDLSLRERAQRDGLVIGTRCAEPDAVDAVIPRLDAAIIVVGA